MKEMTIIKNEKQTRNKHKKKPHSCWRLANVASILTHRNYAAFGCRLFYIQNKKNKEYGNKSSWTIQSGTETHYITQLFFLCRGRIVVITLPVSKISVLVCTWRIVLLFCFYQKVYWRVKRYNELWNGGGKPGKEVQVADKDHRYMFK